MSHEHDHEYMHEHGIPHEHHAHDEAHPHEGHPTHEHEHPHDGEHAHEHAHTHEHTHTHADGTVHSHPHEHIHAHPHDHGEDHEHGHEHGHDHSHACPGAANCGKSCDGCDADPRAEAVALMRYMVGHNTAHANELAQLAENLKKLGDVTAYEQLMQAVSDFEKGNMRLSTVLASMNSQNP